MHFLFSIFFSVSCHIPGQKVFLSRFHNFLFSRHSLSHTMCISHFPPFSVFLTIFEGLEFVFLIFHDFQYSVHTPGPTVCISYFSHFSVFLAIFLVLTFVCLIFHVFQCFSSYSKTKCIFVSFPRFSVFWPYSMSFNLHFSFSTVFSVSRLISRPTM